MPQQFILNKRFDIEIKGEKEVFLTGDISTTVPDMVNDVVSLKCLKSQLAQLKDRSIKLDVEHANFTGDSHEEIELNKAKVPAGKILPVDAKIVDIKHEGKTYQALRVKSKLNPHDKGFVQTKGNVVDGFLDAYSIAYIPTQVGSTVMEGKTLRVLDDVNLLNVALTGTPINSTASNKEVEVKALNSRTISKSIDAHLKARSAATQREINQARNDDEDEDEDKEDPEMKRYKKERKSLSDQLEVKAYEKDGAHAHTEEMPLGEHNHPEIERIMKEEIAFVHERIDFLRDQLFSQESESGSVSTKGKSNSPKSDSQSYKEVKNMTEKKATDPEGAEAGKEDPNAGADTGSDAGEGDAGEGSDAGESTDTGAEAEVKALAGELKAIKADNKSLHDKMDTLLKAMQKTVDSATVEQKNIDAQANAQKVSSVMQLLPR